MSKQSFLKRLSGAAAPAADAVTTAPAPKPAALSSAEVGRRIEVARAEVAELERERREIGIAVETGTAHSAESLAAAILAVNAARERVTTLEGVAEEIHAREQEAERIAKLALWDSRAAARRKHLAEHAAEAKLLAAALAAAVPHYRNMLDRIDRICAAHPDNAAPQWTLKELGSLPEMVGDELDRLWANPKEREQQQQFPGCNRPGGMYDERKIKPLADKVREACDYASKQMKRPDYANQKRPGVVPG